VILAAPAARVGPVILCLEDQPSPLSMRKMVLEKSGYEVLSATSGKEALDLLKRFHVDLVLSDHYLRGEKGTEIAAKIKAIKPKVPILLISGSVERLEDSDATKNVDALIRKDDGPTHLLVSIAKALQL
jgi:CheY-like chemotaxis protein